MNIRYTPSESDTIPVTYTTHKIVLQDTMKMVWTWSMNIASLKITPENKGRDQSFLPTYHSEPSIYYPKCCIGYYLEYLAQTNKQTKSIVTKHKDYDLNSKIHLFYHQINIFNKMKHNNNFFSNQLQWRGGGWRNPGWTFITLRCSFFYADCYANSF